MPQTEISISCSTKHVCLLVDTVLIMVEFTLCWNEVDAIAAGMRGWFKNRHWDVFF